MCSIPNRQRFSSAKIIFAIKICVVAKQMHFIVNQTIQSIYVDVKYKN
jgi:hypothetical protein